MDDPHWYKNAIIYALDVEKFYDSNGDGIGDIAGVKEKLHYLADLGVTCIWLLPIYPSPRRDNGYDITNYYEIDERFGTTDDLLALIHKAGELGMQVLLDLVVNHTSNEHPWFRASRLDPGSGYRDYYVWSSAPPPPPPGQGTMFPGEEDSVWTFDPVAQSYYFHRFYHFEPDLNLDNERVRAEVCAIVDYWMSFGIAGLRLDAAVPMIHEKGQSGSIPADPHATLREIYGYLQKRRKGSVLLGEVDIAPEKVPSFVEDQVQMNLFFNFYLSNYLFLGLATQSATAIERALDMLPSLPPECGWANFLRNLDELDLERLTDEEREKTMAVFAPQESMRIFGRGIRRRLAPMLGGDTRRILLAYSLLLSMPGAPVLVYGDEIGMGDDPARPGREAVRPPMQWSSARNGGFSSARKDKLVAAPIDDGPFSYSRVNVEDQLQREDGLLAELRALLALRRTHSAIIEAAPRMLKPGDDQVLAVAYNIGAGHLIIAHNLSPEPCEVVIGPVGTGTGRLKQVAGPDCIQSASEHRLKLQGYGYAWLTSSTP